MYLKDMTLEQRKATFLVLLYNREGNVTKTCQDIGISRPTYNRWYESDEEFAQGCQMVGESLLDMTEGALVKNIKKGKSTDIQFMLKTKGRSRGYGEKVEVAHTGMIAHAHGIKHYPNEPKSIAEWEEQVKLAEKAEEERKALTEGPNIDEESILDVEPVPVTTA